MFERTEWFSYHSNLNKGDEETMYKDMISVTDELIFNLYFLNYKYIEYRIINHKYYLINRAGEKYKFELQLIAEIPDEILEQYSIDEIVDGCNNNDNKFQPLISMLTFSPKEMLIMNILFSNYLNTKSNMTPEISFKDIEFYRKKSSSYKDVTINDITAESYRNIINGLIDKRLYLKTEDKFRKTAKKNYGVSGREFEQQLLTIYDPYLSSSNNISFKYSFGTFGEVIRLSRRYSCCVPAKCYHYSLNQAIYNVVACDIGRHLYYDLYRRKKPPKMELYENHMYSFKMDFESYFEIIYGKYKKNKARQRKVFYKELKKILEEFTKERKIEIFELVTDYKDFLKGKGSIIKIDYIDACLRNELEDIK